MHNSTFNAGLLSWLWLQIWTWALTVFTLGIAYPWAMCAQYAWRIDNLTVNGYQMRFDGQGHQLIGMWIKWWLLTIVTLGIYGLWVPIKLIKWQATHTFIPALEASQVQQQTTPVSPASAPPMPLASAEAPAPPATIEPTE